jgi:hypothetical protein
LLSEEAMLESKAELPSELAKLLMSVLPHDDTFDTGGLNEHETKARPIADANSNPNIFFIG